jgi:hypothetical protein
MFHTSFNNEKGHNLCTSRIINRLIKQIMRRA